MAAHLSRRSFVGPPGREAPASARSSAEGSRRSGPRAHPASPRPRWRSTASGGTFFEISLYWMNCDRVVRMSAAICGGDLGRSSAAAAPCTRKQSAGLRVPPDGRPLHALHEEPDLAVRQLHHLEDPGDGADRVHVAFSRAPPPRSSSARRGTRGVPAASPPPRCAPSGAGRRRRARPCAEKRRGPSGGP